MIREYKKEDLAACAKVLKEAFSEDTWGCVWTRERAEEYISDYACNPKFVGFVSENEGEIDGAVLACRKVNWNADELYVDELIVAPGKQRRGIGQQLIENLKSYCKENGLAGMVLYTAEEAPAKQFYSKNGFRVTEGVIRMYWV